MTAKYSGTFGLTALLFGLIMPASAVNIAPVLDTITDRSIPIRKSMMIPLTSFDADADMLTYTASSNNANFTVYVHTGNPFIRISVANFGDMEFMLLKDRAPNTARRIQGFADGGLYNGSLFHRVIPNFMIQGGIAANGSDPADMDDEYHPNALFTGTGVLAMANAGDDSNSSQFFITQVPTRHLDFNHSIFGQMVRGMSVLNQIINVPRDAEDKPVTNVVMTKVSTVENRTDGVITVTVASGTPVNQTAQITVTASDGKGGQHQKTFTATAVNDTTNNNPYLAPYGNILTPINTPINIPLQSADLEGDAVTYYQEQTNFPSSLTLTRNGNTLVITPANGFTGVEFVQIGVRATASNKWDTQVFAVGVGDAPITFVQVINQTTSKKSPIVNQNVGLFSENISTGKASDFFADVDWGDGYMTDGPVVKATSDTYFVKGTHTYNGDGVVPLSIAVYGNLGAYAKAFGTATIIRKTAGISTTAAHHSIITQAKDNFYFKVIGQVTIIDPFKFTVSDGGPETVEVVAPGHGLANGDFVIAEGALGGTPAHPVLTSSQLKVTKVN